jgi:hypothetical protein
MSEFSIFSGEVYQVNRKLDYCYPGSTDGTPLNLSLESNAKQDVVICGTVII